MKFTNKSIARSNILSESVTTFNDTNIAYPEPHQLSKSSAFTKFNDTGLARYYQLLPLHLTTKGLPIMIHFNYQYQSVTKLYDIVRLSILILIRYQSPAPIASMDDTRLAYLNPHQLSTYVFTFSHRYISYIS